MEAAFSIQPFYFSPRSSLQEPCKGNLGLLLGAALRAQAGGEATGPLRMALGGGARAHGRGPNDRGVLLRNFWDLENCIYHMRDIWLSVNLGVLFGYRNL